MTDPQPRAPHAKRPPRRPHPARTGPGRFAAEPPIERVYAPDRTALLGALRVALGRPNPTKLWLEDGQ